MSPGLRQAGRSPPLDGEELENQTKKQQTAQLSWEKYLLPKKLRDISEIERYIRDISVPHLNEGGDV